MEPRGKSKVRGGRGEDYKKAQENFRGMVMLINLTVVVVSLQYTYIKTQVFLFKYVQFTISQLYLNKAINT